MPDALHLLPDPVLAVLQYLRARSELVTALLPATNVVEALPTSFSGSYLVVTLAGSSGIWPHFDEPVVQIDALVTGALIGGETQATCSLLARTARAAMWAIRNDTVAAGVLASCAEEIGPQWMPDMTPTIPVARYTARYRPILRP